MAEIAKSEKSGVEAERSIYDAFGNESEIQNNGRGKSLIVSIVLSRMRMRFGSIFCLKTGASPHQKKKNSGGGWIWFAPIVGYSYSPSPLWSCSEQTLSSRVINEGAANLANGRLFVATWEAVSPCIKWSFINFGKENGRINNSPSFSTREPFTHSADFLHCFSSLAAICAAAE